MPVGKIHDAIASIRDAKEKAEGAGGIGNEIMEADSMIQDLEDDVCIPELRVVVCVKKVVTDLLLCCVGEKARDIDKKA